MESRFLRLYNLVMEELDDENDVKNIEFLSDKIEKFINSLKENESFEKIINGLDGNEIDSLNKRIGHSIKINFKNAEIKSLKENLSKFIFNGNKNDVSNHVINLLHEADPEIASSKIINYINSLMPSNEKKDSRKEIGPGLHSIKEYLDIPDVLIKMIYEYCPKSIQACGNGEILCALMFNGGVKDNSKGDFKIGDKRCETKGPECRIVSNATNKEKKMFFGNFNLYSNIKKIVLNKIDGLKDFEEFKIKNESSISEDEQKKLSSLTSFSNGVEKDFENENNQNKMHFTTKKYPSLEMINSIFISNAEKFDDDDLKNKILKKVLLTEDDYKIILKNTLTKYFAESSNYKEDELNSIIELFFKDYSDFLKNLLYFSIKYYLVSDDDEYIVFFNKNVDSVLILQKDNFKVEDIDKLKILATPVSGNAQSASFQVQFNP